MAQDEQLIETDHASRPGGASKALGVLAAVSAGGLMALRMKSAPFMFLAGAAAVALLGRKRIIPSSRPLELMPERPVEPAEPPRVEIDAWLVRQMEREQQAPVITLDVESLPETTPPAPEPLETAKAALEPPVQPPAAFGEFFATIATVPQEPEAMLSTLVETVKPDPVPAVSLWDAPLASPGPEVAATPPAEEPLRLSLEAESAGAGFFFPSEPATSPSPAGQVLYPAPPAGKPNSSWLLGIEPLPSWDELAADSPATSSKPSPDFAFLAEPPGAASYTPQPAPPLAPKPPEQPLFIPSLFQGGALPDEITVADEPPAPPRLDEEPELASAQAPPATTAETIPTQQPSTGLWPSVEPTAPPAPLAEPASTTLGEPVMASPLPGAEFTSAPASPPPMPEPSPASTAELAELIPVSLAAPGEASFDDPLAALEENPANLPGGLPPQPPLRPLAPVVEAEIIVRPRSLAFSRVQARQSPENADSAAQPTPFAPAAPAEAPASPPVGEFESLPEPGTTSQASTPPIPAIPPAPVVLPREQKARKTWRSWWRGD